MKHKSSAVRYFQPLCFLLLLLGLGCGTPAQEIKLHLDQKTLTEAKSYHIWVIKDKLKNGTNVTCLSFLQKAVPFDAEQFDAEQHQDLNINEKQQELTLKKISVGKKLFLVGGFATDPKTPVAVGCTEGDIKDGARLFITIFLAQLS